MGSPCRIASRRSLQANGLAALSGLQYILFGSQGVALGWLRSPFQGVDLEGSAPRSGATFRNEANLSRIGLTECRSLLTPFHLPLRPVRNVL